MTTAYPKWEELPNIDLYLDQVLLYVNQLAAPAAVPNDKGLTSSMINNYVKHGLVEKPVKKKYSRKQLARLIAITTFKPVFSIQELGQVLEALTADNQSQRYYDAFVSCMNGEQDRDIPEIIVSACQTLKLYHHTHKLALNLQGGQK
ncbi:DUF1836 domain-containing protein [Streptococcus dentasini]